MKLSYIYIVFVLMITNLSSVSGQEANSTSNGYLNIIFFNKEIKHEIKAQECQALFIINSDTIISHCDSLYKIQHPFKNTKLIIKYKKFYQEIRSDKYLNSIFIPNKTIFIEIYLHAKNEVGGYIVSYAMGDFGLVEEYGKKEKNGYSHLIKFSLKPSFPFYSKIK